MTLDILLAAVSGGLAGWLAGAAVYRHKLREGRRDPVTGLPGRAAWTRQAEAILRRRGAHLVVLIDLDRFKEINDRHGHQAGDHVLAATAARLRAWAERTGGGACGRLGGDEFVFVSIRPVGGPEVGLLVQALAAPVTLPGAETVPLSASVGSARAVARQLSPGLRAADAAMYAAKRAGGGWRQADDLPDAEVIRGRRGRQHGLVS